MFRWAYRLWGNLAPSFREPFFRRTGWWLWGMDSFYNSRPPSPRQFRIADSGEWRAICDQNWDSQASR